MDKKEFSISKNKNKEKNKLKKDKNKTIKKKTNQKEINEKRKWKEKEIKKYKKGKLTQEEEEIITNSLCEYAFENNLTKNELLNLITEKQNKNKKIWPKIGECLPNRTIQSIHNFCHRKFHPYNYKGKWSLKDEKILLNLVKEYGKKWEKIGKELERSATNCKDKYKNLGDNHHNEIIKAINLSLILKFLKAVENYINDDEPNEKEYPIFNYIYKFNNNVDNNYNVLFLFNEKKNKFLIDSSLKEEQSKIIIKNILKRLINKETLFKIVKNNIEISWNIISSKILFFSVDNCRSEWNKLLKNFEIFEMEENKRDYKLIKKIYNSSLIDIESFDFNLVHNHRKPEENKLKLEDLIRKYDLYGINDFQTNIEGIYEQLKIRLDKKENSNNEDDKEFEEEIKKRNSNNIIKIYSEFLLKKRGRDE